MDVNGDGRPDHVAVDLTTPGNVWVSINNGCSSASNCGFTSAPYSVPGSLRANSRLSYTLTPKADPTGLQLPSTLDEMVDVNGDGIPDLVSHSLL